MSNSTRSAHVSIEAHTNPMRLTQLQCCVALIAAGEDAQHLCQISSKVQYIADEF